MANTPGERDGGHAASEEPAPSPSTPEPAGEELMAMPSTTAAEPAGEAAAEPKRKANIVVLKSQAKDAFNPEQQTTFHLVGTSHVSNQSVEDVRQLIQEVRPEVVMLELCEQRTNTLQPVDRSQERAGALACDCVAGKSFQQHLALWREGKEPLLAVVYSWMLSSVANKCEIVPGEEFRVALEEASKVGAKVMLGDRLVSITLARAWAALTLWQKLSFLGDLLWMGLFVPGKEIDAIHASLTGDSDVLTEAIREFGRTHPALIRTLIDERDAYMVWMLRRLAAVHKATRVVAVVGAGHLAGLQDKWEADVDIEELVRMPEPRPRRPWRSYLLIATAGSVVVASVTVAVHWRRQRS